MRKNKKWLCHAITAIGLALVISEPVLAQPGSSRKELQRQDLNIPGRESVQVVVTIGQGETSPTHKHPGEEIIYVLEGSLEYKVNDDKPVRIDAGGVFFIPAGAVHAAKNVGNGDAKELATYIVEKNKPLVVIVK
jgi:quercetin dioxygenase-like cupin family protein